MDKKEPSLMVAIDDLSRSGASSRIYMAISKKPKDGLSLEEIIETTRLSKATVRCYGIPNLLRAQVVERQKTQRGKIFRLAPGFMVRFEGAK